MNCPRTYADLQFFIRKKSGRENESHVANSSIQASDFRTTLCRHRFFRAANFVVEPVVFKVRKVRLVGCEHPLHVRLHRSVSCNLLVGVC